MPASASCSATISSDGVHRAIWRSEISSTRCTSVSATRVGQRLEQVAAAAQLLELEVDAQGERAAARSGRLPHRGEAVRDDDLGQLVEHPQLGGRADEHRRRERADLQVPAAHQRLVAADLAAGDVDDRLVGDLDPALVEHLAQHLAGVVPPGRAVPGPRALVGPHLVLGGAQQQVGVVGGGLGELGADADLDGEQLVADRDRGAQGARRSSTIWSRWAPVAHVRQHHGELVAAHPGRDRVVGERPVAQPRAELAQHLVGVEVPDLLVDLLEAVDVEEEDADGLADPRLGEPSKSSRK